MLFIFTFCLTPGIEIYAKTGVDGGEGDFSLIRYIELSHADSREDVVSAIEFYTDESVPIDDEYDDAVNVTTNIAIDYENELVYVVTETSEVISSTATSKTISASSKKEVYSDAGKLIYTLEVKAEFKYASGKSCTVNNVSGSFKSSSSSLWSSTPTFSQGTVSKTKAYASISGTAKLLLRKKTYLLKMFCDSKGNITSTYSEP